MSNVTELKPYVRRIIGDLDTPVSVYLKLHKPNSFLLESVTGGEQVGRYSFIGLDPICTLITDENKTVIQSEEGSDTGNSDPIEAVHDLISQFHMDDYPELPPFLGGAVGYFSWETIGHIEKISFNNKIKTDFPVAHFMVPRTVVVFDHAKREIIMIVLDEEGREESSHDGGGKGGIRPVVHAPAKLLFACKKRHGFKLAWVVRL